MDMLEAIHRRRAITRFLPEPVAKEEIGIILDAARMAPSSGNLQNWRFIVVQDPALKAKVAKACFDQVWLETAPTLIIVCAELDKVRRFYGVRGEQLYAIQNCAVAAQNILLAATYLGLGSNFVSIFDDEYLAHILSLPDNAKAQAVIPIGYTDQVPDVPVRYPLETLVYFNAWKQGFEELEHVLRHHGAYHKKYVEKVVKKTQEVQDKLHEESESIFDKVKKKIDEHKDKV